MTILTFAVVVWAFGACGSGQSPEDYVWLNPSVEDHCVRLQRIQEVGLAGGSLPRDFPLPEGATIVGRFPGDPPIVHLRAPGGFLELDSFFKSELENEGWAGGSASNGSDPSGRYGSVVVNGRGYRGDVSVVQCGEDDPEILVKIARKPEKG